MVTRNARGASPGSLVDFSVAVASTQPSPPDAISPFPVRALRSQNARMPIHVYHYPKCSTCRRARKWLDEHDVSYSESDLVADPIPLAKLRDLHKRSGLPVARLFNTSGESYRAGNFKERSKKMSDADLLAALAKDGKLVKRPILDTGKSVLIGFDEDAYSELVG